MGVKIGAQTWAKGRNRVKWRDRVKWITTVWVKDDLEESNESQRKNLIKGGLTMVKTAKTVQI